MAIDSGVQAPAGSAPAGVTAGSGVEVRVADPVGESTPSYVYLFRSQTLDPGAGAATCTTSTSCSAIAVT